jgi:hypothetical protein
MLCLAMPTMLSLVKHTLPTAMLAYMDLCRTRADCYLVYEEHVAESIHNRCKPNISPWLLIHFHLHWTIAATTSLEDQLLRISYGLLH